MIREDIENLNFNELNELEKQEYVAILTLNLRRITLQLMNSGDTMLAGIISIAISLCTFSPMKAQHLLLYGRKLFEAAEAELEILKRSQEMQKEPEPSEPDDFPNLDSEKEN